MKIQKIMKIQEVQNRNAQLMEELLKIWEESVRATHLFLSNEEIKHIRTYVPQAIGFYAVACIPKKNFETRKKGFLFLTASCIIGKSDREQLKFKRLRIMKSGVWLSLVERTAGGREVAGSNPVTPIKRARKIGHE